jgi:hypothetical protein
MNSNLQNVACAAECGTVAADAAVGDMVSPGGIGA